MKLLIVMQHINFFRNLDTVVREFDARGHETVMLHGTRLDDPGTKARVAAKKQKMVFMGRGIGVAEEGLASLTTGYRPEPEEAHQQRLRTGRLVMNRGIYLRKGHPSPERTAEKGGLSPRMIQYTKSPLVRAVLRRPLALRAWRRIEAANRPSASVTSVLRDIQPDVVLVSPTVWPKKPIEADYIHAARKLGIPTVGYLNSWDNLTSKGTVHVLPDVFVVWNEALASEAEELHSIPRSIIRVTGAPHLDHFFESEPSLSRAQLCHQLGCPDDRPYIVYLCSSRTLIQDETHVVTRLADALARQHPERAPMIVIRPHPVNPGPWENYDHPGTTVFPKHGDQADTPESWQEYFNQLSGASCFVGLNTTAFLEAAVTDRPCLTIVSDEFFDQQGRTGHFRHLLAADFLEVSADVAQVATRVGRVVDGVDEKAAWRRRFVQEFLRPRGVETSAKSVVADTIEALVPEARASVAPQDVQPDEPVVLAAREGS
ncbi:MAG: hypothetical protein H0V12_02895 [Chloroflexi bacterium]|nr:hypothetical protein [Chloroflexota bacterium]